MSEALALLRDNAAPIATGVVAGTVSTLVGISPATGIALTAVAAAGSFAAAYTGRNELAMHLRAGAIGIAAGTTINVARRALRAPSGWPVTEGASILLWDNIRSRVDRLGGVLERTQPQVIIVHGNDRLDADVVATMRRLVPGVRFHTEQWVNGPADVDEAIDRARRSADLLEPEAVIWNVEAPWKNTGAEGRAAAQRLLASWSGTPQGYTSYAQPTQHSSFPWAAFSGGRDSFGSYDLACAFSLPQVYPFGDDKGRSDRTFIESGVMQRTMRRSLDSWATAVQRGIISPNVKSAPMLPSAWVRSEDELEALGLDGDEFPLPPFAAWFAWHGVIDADCEQVIRRFREAY